MSSKRIRKYIVSQCIKGVGWKDLVGLESESELTDETSNRNLAEIVESIHDAKSIFFVVEGAGYIIMKDHGPIKVKEID